MLLKEFFSRGLSLNLDHSKSKDSSKIDDELFWFILDHDKLHKDYFHPLASKIKQENFKGEVNKDSYVAEFMPMVKKGCLEFYHHKKMNGKISKLFPDELREGICERLFDHYYEDILKDQYQVK